MRIIPSLLMRPRCDGFDARPEFAEWLEAFVFRSGWELGCIKTYGLLYYTYVLWRLYCVEIAHAVPA